MQSPSEHALISTAALAAILNEPDLRVIDASWWLDGRDALADFEGKRLPKAVFFDLEAVADHTSPYPHMLPAPEAFAAELGRLGIRDRDDIIVYDSQGLFSAARVWWMLKIIGAQRVRVLDGGLPKWLGEERPTNTGTAIDPAPATFIPHFDAAAVIDLEQVRQALDTEVQVLDARGAPRFQGQVVEPRPGVRSGHMPGALNLPYGQLLNNDGTLKQGGDLLAAFRDAGTHLDRPIITTCGSGVTAAIVTLALHTLGKGSRLYDGSWAEWGAREDAPLAVG